LRPTPRDEEVATAMNRRQCLLHFTTRDGRSLAGASFAVEHAEAPVPEMAYVTGPDGVARIGLPPGTVTLRVFPVSGMSRLVSLVITDQAEQIHEVFVNERAD
jgi:hypothetical protein